MKINDIEITDKIKAQIILVVFGIAFYIIFGINTGFLKTTLVICTIAGIAAIVWSFIWSVVTLLDEDIW